MTAVKYECDWKDTIYMLLQRIMQSLAEKLTRGDLVIVMHNAQCEWTQARHNSQIITLMIEQCIVFRMRRKIEVPPI